MKINYQSQNVDEAIKNNEPLLAVISFDGSAAWIGHIDDNLEHHILLTKLGLPPTDIDKYFRIVFDRDGADWTFACPNNYMNITDKTKRTTMFYKNGFTVISKFLSQMDYIVGINIPKRYRRHIIN